MIEEIRNKEYYSNSEQKLIDKMNEIIDVVSKMRSDIDELMNDLFYRETIEMETNE